MQIWAEPEKAALPICNYSQILYQFLTFRQNLKRSLVLLLQSFFDCGKAFFTDNMFHFACIFCCDFLWYTKTF